MVYSQGDAQSPNSALLALGLLTLIKGYSPALRYCALLSAVPLTIISFYSFRGTFDMIFAKLAFAFVIYHKA